MMRPFVRNDLHLKPAASDYELDALAVPDDVDGAVVLGDLTHRAAPTTSTSLAGSSSSSTPTSR